MPTIAEKTPKPIDFTEQHKFGYTGEQIKLALKQKIHGLEEALTKNYEMLHRELGDDTEVIATLVPALLRDGEDSSRILIIKSIALTINNHQDLLDRLRRISRGIADKSVYVLSDEDLRLFGL